jgi:hypothetical protein
MKKYWPPAIPGVSAGKIKNLRSAGKIETPYGGLRKISAGGK